MGFLAFGIFLLLLGALLALAGVDLLLWAGWVCLALGAILTVMHVAVGPRRTREMPPSGRRSV